MKTGVTRISKFNWLSYYASKFRSPKKLRTHEILINLLNTLTYLSLAAKLEERKKLRICAKKIDRHPFVF